MVSCNSGLGAVMMENNWKSCNKQEGRQAAIRKEVSAIPWEADGSPVINDYSHPSTGIKARQKGKILVRACSCHSYYVPRTNIALGQSQPHVTRSLQPRPRALVSSSRNPSLPGLCGSVSSSSRRWRPSHPSATPVLESNSAMRPPTGPVTAWTRGTIRAPQVSSASEGRDSSVPERPGSSHSEKTDPVGL